jgi:hypothetical protein
LSWGTHLRTTVLKWFAWSFSYFDILLRLPTLLELAGML